MDNEPYVFEYQGFRVNDASTNFSMTFDSFNAANSSVNCDLMDRERGRQFSTFDRDNDAYSGSCADFQGQGGRWFKSCVRFNPNSWYSAVNVDSSKYMSTGCISGWKTLKFTRLMLEI